MSAPKILIENQNALGHNVEQVSLDTNRVNVYSETTSRFANLIALSSRGLWVDISQWVVYSAAFWSVAELAVSAGVPFWAVSLFAGVPFLILLAMIGTCCDRRESLRPHGLLRFFLLTLGTLIAVL